MPPQSLVEVITGKSCPAELSENLVGEKIPTHPLLSPPEHLPFVAVGLFSPLEGKESLLNLGSCFLRHWPVTPSWAAPSPVPPSNTSTSMNLQ